MRKHRTKPSHGARSLARAIASRQQDLTVYDLIADPELRKSAIDLVERVAATRCSVHGSVALNVRLLPKGGGRFRLAFDSSCCENLKEAVARIV